MKVRALTQGFHGGRHIDPGTIFDVDPKLYAGRDDPDPSKAKFGWMEKVDADLPLSDEANITPAPKKKSFVDKMLGK